LHELWSRDLQSSLLSAPAATLAAAEAVRPDLQALELDTAAWLVYFQILAVLDAAAGGSRYAGHEACEQLVWLAGPVSGGWRWLQPTDRAWRALRADAPEVALAELLAAADPQAVAESARDSCNVAALATCVWGLFFLRKCCRCWFDR
jgi:hypothetical protein